MHVKKEDTVYILTGKDRGKTGKVTRVLPREDKVLVEGINMKKVHQRPKKSGDKGEIIEKSFPVHISNVKLAKDTPKAKDSKEKQSSKKEAKKESK